MATTSIWAVKGWLGKVVLYIENPEKTENPQFYRQKNMTDVQVQNLSDVIDYAARPERNALCALPGTSGRHTPKMGYGGVFCPSRCRRFPIQRLRKSGRRSILWTSGRKHAR